MAAEVLKELRLVLTDARHPVGRENPIATYSEVAAELKQNENVIRKFERGDSAPKYDRVDALVSAYANATGVSAFDLWDKAIKEARKAEKKLKRAIGSATGTKPTQAQRQAELNAEKHEAELESELAAESRQSRPSGLRSSKSKRGSGSR
jgi:hypothetical protein